MAQTMWDCVHLDDTAPLAGFTRGNEGAGVDKILYAKTMRPLREGKPGQRWNRVDGTACAFGRPRQGVAGRSCAPAVLLAPSFLAETWS